MKYVVHFRTYDGTKNSIICNGAKERDLYLKELQ